MVSLLKRTKSALQIRQQQTDKDASRPPMPQHIRSTQTNKGGPDLTLEMPDLRFSKIDLDAQVQAIGQQQGWQSERAERASSPVIIREQRKSKLAFFGYGSGNNSQQNSIASSSVDDLPASNGSSSGKRRTSALPPSHPMTNKLASSSVPHLHQPKLSTPSQPVPPPRSAARPNAASPLSSQAPPLSKKQLEREEKERMQREKDRAKQYIKEQKEAQRREKKELKKAKSNGNIKSKGVSEQQRQTQEKDAAPSKKASHASPPSHAQTGMSKPETKRALNSATNIHNAAPPAPRNQMSVMPNFEKPTTPPISGPINYEGWKVVQQQQQQQQHPHEQRTSQHRISHQFVPRSAATSPVTMHSMESTRFPNPYDTPNATLASTKYSTPPSSPSKTRTDLTQVTSPGLFTESESGISLNASTSSTATAKDKVAKGKTTVATSSSEGGTGSTTTNDGGRRKSLESNTTFEDSGDENTHQSFTSMPSASNQPRPARDEEREERAQSRLSMNLDGELQKATTARPILEVDTRPSSAAQALINPAVTSLKQQHGRTDSAASKQSTFSAMLLASRPGGAADLSIDKQRKEEEEKREEEENRNRIAAMQAHQHDGTNTAAKDEAEFQKQQQAIPSVAEQASTAVKRMRERAPARTAQASKERTVQPELVARGNGWSCQGVGEIRPADLHWRTVKETIKVAVLREKDDENETPEADASKYDFVDEEVDAHYNDLFELLFTATTPDVTSRILSHLDISDIKGLRQTSSQVRLAVGANRELILNQFLSCIGYRTWTYVKGSAIAYKTRLNAFAPPSSQSNTSKDPCPLSLQDLEAFIIAQDLLPEYATVGQDAARDPQSMDPGIGRLARGTTRAHNRVLTRLRLQPNYKVPSTTPSKKIAASVITSSPQQISSTRMSVNGPGKDPVARHNSYYDFKKQSPTFGDYGFDFLPPNPSFAGSQSALSSGMSTPVSTLPSPLTAPSTPSSGIATPLLKNSSTMVEAKPSVISPWKPGRAALYRVWVPAKDPSGWLSDEELAACEQELFKSGIWNFMKRGDIVWDTAVGEQANEGKYVFDGKYLRDLSYAYDYAGHLPSWLNVVLFSPSYWHNIIKSSTPQPVVYMDISPWKDQILSSLRLVQDHVDTFSGHGARYRIAKWLYRAAANVTPGQIVTRMNALLEIVDDGWNGRIVVETDGTAESAKVLVARCAGPDASAAEKAQLLAAVMGDAQAATKMLNTHDTNGPVRPTYHKFSGPNGRPLNGQMARQTVEQQNAPWAIMRERCRPGLIWVRPLLEREKVA